MINDAIDVKRDGEGPLHYAVRGGKIDIIKFLLEKHSLNPSATSNSGATPIDIAVSLNQHEIVAVLRVATSLCLSSVPSGSSLRSSWLVKVSRGPNFSITPTDKSTRNLLSMLDSDDDEDDF